MSFSSITKYMPKLGPKPEPPSPVKRVNLALQGGGAHGAFTWGVLDTLLADERLEFEGISGTSAGAMNAVALAQGWTENGRAGAREALERFWVSVSTKQSMSPLRNAPWERALYGWDMTYSWAWQGFETLVRTFSPYQFNPFDFNPLREVVRDTINFETLRACKQHKLFISATDVATGKPRIFHHQELSADVLMASACLPYLFQAVKIEDRHYWDGGYAGNPSLWPLYDSCLSADIVLVEINPINRPELPTSAQEILNRVNEIGMNTALIGEIRSINFVQRMLAEKQLDPRKYRRLFLHSIHDEDKMNGYNVSTKFNADLSFLRELKRMGETSAKAWLDNHWDDIGQRDSVDVRARYL